MITRNFNLFLSAGRSVPLVINANQAEEGEQWVFSLFQEDGTPYIPTDGAIVGIKSDGYLINNSGTVVDGKVVIAETQQMTAAAGKAVFELRIDGLTHGTANFIVLVEEDPTNEGVVSDSDLSLIEEALSAVSPLPTGGSVGQVLTKTASGSTWSNAGTPTQEQVADAVSDWADEHITVSTGVVIDTSLSVAGAAADAKKTGDEITDLKSAIEAMGGGIPSEVRKAMSTLFNSAVYKYEGLTDEKAVIASWAATVTAISISQSSISISGSGTYQLTATTIPSGGTVTWSSSNTAVATVSNNGLVTSVGNGTATITASCGGLTATCTATVSGFATLSSISAVFTQGDNVIYDTDSLDDLKQYLVVTATYSNSQTAVLSDDAYTLSGSLTTGTSTITASYQSKSDTFNVTVTAFWDIDWKYTDGVPTDFGFTISPNNGTYTMTDDGYKVKTNANNTDANCRPTTDFGATSGTLETTLRWAIIPPNSMGTTIGGVGWGISIFGGKIWFNYDALGNNTNAVEVMNVSTNTDYTIRCEYTPTLAKVYVNDELMYTYTGTRTNTRTRYMVNLVNKGGIEHYIKAMRCHAES